MSSGDLRWINLIVSILATFVGIFLLSSFDGDLVVGVLIFFNIFMAGVNFDMFICGLIKGEDAK